MPIDDSSPKTVLMFQVRRRRRVPRWLLVLAAITMAGLLSCVIGWLVIALLFSPSQTLVPAEVEVIARRIAPIRVPAHFQAVEGWEADHWLAWIQMARFEHDAGRGLLMLGELHVRPVPQAGEVDQLRKLLENSAANLRSIAPKQSQERTVKVRGKDAKFEIIEGEDRASTTRMRQVTGTFPGHEATALLILQCEAEFLTDETIEDLLKSLSESTETK